MGMTTQTQMSIKVDIHYNALTDGSSGPLVSPLSVIQTDDFAKGASIIRGSKKYPIDR